MRTLSRKGDTAPQFERSHFAEQVRCDDHNGTHETEKTDLHQRMRHKEQQHPGSEHPALAGLDHAPRAHQHGIENIAEHDAGQVPHRCLDCPLCGDKRAELRTPLRKRPTAYEEKRGEAEEHEQNWNADARHRLEIKPVDVSRECGEKSERHSDGENLEHDAKGARFTRFHNQSVPFQ